MFGIDVSWMIIIIVLPVALLLYCVIKARNRADRLDALRELSSVIAFAAFVAALVFGGGFLRGLTLHHVYGDTARSLARIMRDHEEWVSAGPTVESSAAQNVEAKPESLEPYLVVKIGEFHTNDPVFWDVLAWSGKSKDSLDEAQTVVFCEYTEKTTYYGLGGAATGQGTSDFVNISYVNGGTGECFFWESFGRELPSEVTSLPHYKVSDNKLLAHIKGQLKQFDQE